MKQKLLAVLLGMAAVLVPAFLMGAADLTGRPTTVGLVRDTAWTLVIDDKPLYFGNDSDFDLHWDSTNALLELEPLAANGTFRFGSEGLGLDVYFIGATDANTLWWDASANTLKTSGSVTIALEQVNSTDDAYIGDDLDVDGAMTVDETVTATGTIQGATLIGTSGLRVGSTTAYGVASGIDWTSTTLTAGATTCTVTLPWTPDWTQDVVSVSLVPNDNLKLYAGHGNHYIVPEGGTGCEVKITSATFTTLYVFVEMKRLTAAGID